MYREGKRHIVASHVEVFVDELTKIMALSLFQPGPVTLLVRGTVDTCRSGERPEHDTLLTDISFSQRTDSYFRMYFKTARPRAVVVILCIGFPTIRKIS